MRRRTSALLALALLLAACAAKPKPDLLPGQLPDKVFPMPSDGPPITRRAPKELEATGHRLVEKLGDYPPRFANEAERDQVYAEWSDMLRDVKTRDWSRAPSKTARLAVLADLYRLGHNLDVAGSAELAEDTFKECLASDAFSIGCNWTRAEFYTSVEPTSERLMLAEASLDTLRTVLGPQPDRAVEFEYIKLRLMGNDLPGAQAAMDSFLEKFPDEKTSAEIQALQGLLENADAIERKNTP
jgi:hypothetical protein